MQEFLLTMAVATRIIVNALAYVFQKKLTLHAHPMFVNLANYGALALVSLVLVPWHRLHELSTWFWIYSLVGGMAGALGNAFIIKALETGELSVLGPINAYKSIVGLVFAYFIMHEVPTAAAFAGMLLIIAGSYVLLSGGSGQFQWRMLLQPAIIYRLLALVLTGFQAVMDKKIIQLSDLRIAFCSWSISGFLFAFLLFKGLRLSWRAQWTNLRRQDLNMYGLMIVCIGTMTITTNYCFAHMPVAEALALFQLSILLTVFFGYSFFKEEHLWTKLLGALIMVMGSLAIIVFR